MLLHVRALHLVPKACSTLAQCLPSTRAELTQILEQPLVERVPVLDDAGVPYAEDMVLTQGFFLLVISYVCVREARNAILRILRNDDMTNDE